MTKREVVARLRAHGARLIGGTKHERWISPAGDCKTSVPRHAGDVPKGTVHAIESDMEHCFGKGWLTR